MASRLLRKRIRLLSLCFSTISTVFLCTSVKILVQVPLHRGASYSLVSLVGEDVILPFQLNPPQDVTLLTVEWVKDQLVPKYVYVYHNSKYQYDVSNTGFKERTTLSQERLEHGDVSLKLFDVQLSDRGNYTCEVPKLGQFQDIELIIGSVSSPVISLLGLNGSGLVLGCESKGWYPQPEVSWLDSEGNILPAGATETVQGSDGLHTINSTLTVQKTDTNIFICKLHQVDINQTREQQFHIPVDLFPSAYCHILLSILVPLLLLLFLIPLALYVCHQRIEKQKSSIGQVKRRSGQHGEDRGEDLEMEKNKEETSLNVL